MFDFEKPKSRDTIETNRTLAGMSKFIITDLTDAESVPAQRRLRVTTAVTNWVSTDFKWIEVRQKIPAKEEAFHRRNA